MRRNDCIALAAALFLLASGSAAHAATPSDKDLCKSGGFAEYIDPTTDAPFKNQGRCVSFVNGGGTLVPVQEEPPVPVAPTAKITVTEYDPSREDFVANVVVQGSPDTSYDLTVQNYDGTHSRTVLTNADGLAGFWEYLLLGTSVTVSHGSTVLASAENPGVRHDAPLTVTVTLGEPNAYNLWPVYIEAQGGSYQNYQTNEFTLTTNRDGRFSYTTWIRPGQTFTLASPSGEVYGSVTAPRAS